MKIVLEKQKKMKKTKKMKFRKEGGKINKRKNETKKQK